MRTDRGLRAPARLLGAALLAGLGLLPGAAVRAATVETVSSRTAAGLIDPTDTRVFQGDYLLSNPTLRAVVADPTLLSGRSSSRWAVSNPGAAVVSLRNEDGVNGLIGFHPGPHLLKPDAPQNQQDFTDETQAWRQPGRAPREGDPVVLEMPEYEAASGRLISEIMARPPHRRGEPNPRYQATYRLGDGDRWLSVESRYSSGGAERGSVTTTASLTTVGRTHLGTAFAGHLAWIYDADRGYAYGVVDKESPFRVRPSRDGMDLTPAAFASGVRRIGGNETFGSTRMVIPGRDVFEVLAVAGDILGTPVSPAPVTLAHASGSPVAGALVELLRNGEVVGAGRSDAQGRLAVATLPGVAADVIRVTPVGRAAIEQPATPGAIAITIPDAAELRARVADAMTGGPLPFRVWVQGVEGTPDPVFGPLSGRDRVANTLLGAGMIPVAQELDPGTYLLTFSAGPMYEVQQRKVEARPGAPLDLEVGLAAVPAPANLLAADLHTHTVVSGITRHHYLAGYDGDPVIDGDGIGDVEGRLVALAAAGIQMVVATEHNTSFDDTAAARAAGLGDRLLVVPGVGFTAGRRHAQQHYNVFPVPVVPHAQDGGALQRPQHTNQLRWAAGWDTGAPKFIVSVEPKASRLGVRREMDAVEVDDFMVLGEGGGDAAVAASRLGEWIERLREGYRIPAVAGQSLFDNRPAVGRVRTLLIESAAAAAAKDPGERLLASLRRGRAVLTTGPWLTLEVADGQATGLVGDDIHSRSGTVTATIAAGWNNGVRPGRVLLLLDGRPVETFALEPGGSAALPWRTSRSVTLAQDGFLQAAFVGESVLPVPGLPEVAVTNPVFVDVGADGYAPHSPLDDRTDTRLVFARPVLAGDGLEPGLLTVRLENESDRPTSDTLRVVAVPPENIRIAPERIDYTLRPRETADLTFEVSFPPEFLAKTYPVQSHTYVAQFLSVRTERSAVGVGRRPATSMLEIDHPLSAIPPETPVEELERALGDVRPMPTKNRHGPSRASLRFALCGDRLAVVATVDDPDPRVSGATGAGVEVFTDMVHRRKITTVLLLPESAGTPAHAAVERGGRLEPVTDVAVHSRREGSGYVLSGLIPVTRTGLDLDHDRLLIEARVHVPEGGRYVPVTIMGNGAPHADHRPYPSFRPVFPVSAAWVPPEPIPSPSGGRPVRATLRLSNHSDRDVTDAVVCRPDPRAGVTAAPARAEFCIPAGASVDVDWTLTPESELLTGALEVKVPRSERGWIGLVPPLTVPVIGRAIPAVPDATAALEGPVGAADSTLRDAQGTARGRVRLADLGESLLLVADVEDGDPVIGPRIWDGSVVELFLQPGGTGEITQVFLTPAADGQAAAARIARIEGPEEAADIAVRSEPVSGGYRIVATIPRPAYGLEGDTVALEVQSSVPNPGGRGRTLLTAFGSRLAYMDGTFFGRFAIAPRE